MCNFGSRFVQFGHQGVATLMRRKLLGIFAISLILAVTWIYWSTNAEVNNAVRLVSYRRAIVKDFILEPSNQTCGKSPFLIMIVTSYVGHVELRSAHRRAMTKELLEAFNATRIFLLARIPQTERFITQESIGDESSIFEDILQGSFTENYRNLTLKHIMGLRWASTVCDQARFILKVDDDTVFNLNKTYDLLQTQKNVDGNNFLMGYMLNNTVPRRSKQNKWYVTLEEFPRNIYPPYLSGWYYITTPTVAAVLVNEAKYHPYFWIDDIYVTGVLTESLGIQLRQLPQNFWLEYYELLECCLRDMMKRYIRCDSVVGPNGGRNNLIVEFNNVLRNCDAWRNCTIRKHTEPLTKVCVAYKDRDIFSDGQAQVQFIKF